MLQYSTLGKAAWRTGGGETEGGRREVGANLSAKNAPRSSNLRPDRGRHSICGGKNHFHHEPNLRIIPDSSHVLRLADHCCILSRMRLVTQ